eukprot:gnl/TRDRNA2_/TRDRNA2_50180_c0_seq2.p1 gnl/TRDRNA2_/TRDRNA2_50180_c0~~gnl/TRDRNA2_/TRDRNA2_50180_c0_seq2.p1  ORF type:complete len:264 (+),score=49.64 gnl/TRDRNA2_/TRDRNA2_50180_c0_seq2:100-792(+)
MFEARITTRERKINVEVWQHPNPPDLAVILDKHQMSWIEVVRLLREDSADGRDLRKLLTDVLKAAPFEGFFWETPPLSKATWESQIFEFVLITAPHLATSMVDTESFAEHLGPYKGKQVARIFKNLGGDSDLVAPAQTGNDPSIFTHAASFFRKAADTQVDALWRTVGDAIDARIRRLPLGTPMWVSTEGSGVAWLHVRLDPRPKYYHHAPYRQWPQPAHKGGEPASREL